MGNNINLNDMINKAKNNGVELGQGTIIKKENKKESPNFILIRTNKREKIRSNNKRATI